MTLPTPVTSFLNDSNRLHGFSLMVKLMGLGTALCIGFFGHDWSSAGGVAMGALAVSSTASVVAKNAGN